MSETATIDEIVVIDGVRYRGQPHIGRNRHEQRRDFSRAPRYGKRPAKSNPMPIAKGKYSEGSALVRSCPECGGAGRLYVMYVHGTQSEWCERCQGTGKLRKGKA